MPLRYTIFNIDTHEIVKRVSSNLSLLNLKPNEDWIEGDFDDRFVNIAPGVYGDPTPEDPEGKVITPPTPYLKENPYTQAELRKEIIKKRKLLQGVGFDFDFRTIPGGNPEDPRGIHHIGTTKEDLEGWDEVTKFASLMQSLGQQNTEIAIDTDTGPTTIQAWEWTFVLLASGQFRQPLWARASELSYLDPIPQDVVSNDAYWNLQLSLQDILASMA